MSCAPAPRHVLTGRLDLRPLAPADLDCLHPLLSDPRNYRHIPGGPRTSLQASCAWIERFSASWTTSGLGYWTVRLRGTGAVIGAGGAERRPAFWNLYYLLSPPTADTATPPS